MAKQFTEKSRFKSKYTDGYVAGPQYLAELICEKRAAKRKVSLPWKFWQTDEWKKDFLAQLNHANKLVKEYDVHIIIQALKDRRCYKLESLGARFVLEPIIKELVKAAELRENTKAEQSQPVIQEAPSDTRRITKGKKSLLGEL